MTASSSTLQKSAIFDLISLERKRSVRHSRMSGWIPILSSSFTECCVGLVLSSWAAAINGTKVTWTNRVCSRPSSWRIWRIASMKGNDSMSPTVPPTSTMTTSTSCATFFIAALISLVTWGKWRRMRSEEHTSELQSPCNLVCRLLLEKKKKKYNRVFIHYEIEEENIVN